MRPPPSRKKTCTVGLTSANASWFWPTFRDRTGPGSVLEAVIIAGHVNTRISMLSYRTWQA
jgi:hypothetical protein